MRSDAVDIAYENLANAIIVQAVTDYRGLLSGNKPSPSVHHRECERFFKSTWFDILTSITKLNGTDLMNTIRKEFNLESYIDTVNT